MQHESKCGSTKQLASEVWQWDALAPGTSDTHLAPPRSRTTDDIILLLSTSQMEWMLGPDTATNKTISRRRKERERPRTRRRALGAIQQSSTVLLLPQRFVSKNGASGMNGCLQQEMHLVRIAVLSTIRNLILRPEYKLVPSSSPVEVFPATRMKALQFHNITPLQRAEQGVCPPNHGAVMRCMLTSLGPLPSYILSGCGHTSRAHSRRNRGRRTSYANTQ